MESTSTQASTRLETPTRVRLGWMTIRAGWRVRIRLRWRKVLREREQGGMRLLGLAAIVIGIVIFVVGSMFVGGHFLATKGISELLRSSLSGLFLGVTGAMVLSSLGHAASAFFAAKDLWFWDSAPAPTWAKFWDRTWETIFAALPATMSMGAMAIGGLLWGYGCSSGLLARAIAALVSLTILPLCLGIVLAHLGGAWLPAGRLRRLSMLALGVLVMCGLIWLRSMRIEDWMTPQGAEAFLMEARQVAYVGPRWLPSSAAAAFTLDGGWPDAGFLIGLDVIALLGAYVVHVRLYQRARDRADDDAPRALRAQSLRVRLFARALGYLSHRVRPIVRKDVLVFLRDPSQWSQVILLVGLAVLYVVNARALSDGFVAFGEIGLWILAAMHVGLSAFIAAGLAARFAFPQLSLEGQASWLLEGAPVEPGLVLRAKLIGILPIVAGFPSLVGLIGGWVLNLPWPLWLASSTFVVALSSSLAAFGLGRGSQHPVYDSVGVTELAMGPGALSTMAIAMVYCAGGAFSTALACAMWNSLGAGWGFFALLPFLVLGAMLQYSVRSAWAGAIDAFYERRRVGMTERDTPPKDGSQ